MTVKAELDPRGQEIYGASSIILDPEPRRHLLIDPQRLEAAALNAVRIVDLGPIIPLQPLVSEGLSGRSREIKILHKDSVREYKIWSDLKSRSGGMIYNYDDINRLNEVVLLPGIDESETVSAKLIWEKDLPVISKLKRWWEQVRTAVRYDSVIN